MISKAKINKIFEKFQQQNPDPKTELEYINPFTLVVAVVLSAQSTDKMVNKITSNLFKLIKSPSDLVKMGEEKFRKHISSIGLYNAKAKNLVKLAEALVRDYDSKVPNNQEALELLPGVGRKSANVILSVIFGQDRIAVDTHVFRVANRIGLVDAKTPIETERQLMKNIPKKWHKHAHHWLVLHGRYVCKARKPECYRCIIGSECEYYANVVKSGSSPHPVF